MSSVHTPIDSPDPSILPRALQSQDFPSARSFDPNNNPPIFPLPIQEGSTNLQSCPNDAAYNTAVASTMADPPPSRARIVPIMAGRKYTAKPKAGSSSASSSRSSLRKKALKGEKLEPEELRIQCLDDRKLYASPIKGDGMFFWRFFYLAACSGAGEKIPSQVSGPHSLTRMLFI